MKEEKDERELRDDEIDLVKVVQTIWDNRKTIYKTVAVFFVLGILIAFLSPKRYTATSTLLPEFEATENSLGRFSSMLDFAGIKLNNQSVVNTIPPELYPQIVGSFPFKRELLNSYILTGANDSSRLFDILETEGNENIIGKIKKYTIGIPGVIINSLRKENKLNAGEKTKLPVKLTKREEGIYKELGERIQIQLDDETGIIQISMTLGNDIASAVATQEATDLLQKYVIDYKINKTRANLEFVNARYIEFKEEFDALRNELAKFKDKNRNVNTELVKMKERKLEDEYELISGVYQGLAQQKEEAELKVKEETPVFTIIEEARIPIKKSAPKRSKIIIVMIFLGGIVGLFFIYFRFFLKRIIEAFNISSNIRY